MTRPSEAEKPVALLPDGKEPFEFMAIDPDAVIDPKDIDPKNSSDQVLKPISPLDEEVIKIEEATGDSLLLGC